MVFTLSMILFAFEAFYHASSRKGIPGAYGGGLALSTGNGLASQIAWRIPQGVYGIKNQAPVAYRLILTLAW